MAGFEGTRRGPLSGADREWRLGRFAPLYVAGILAGVGLGFTIATWPDETAPVRDYSPVVAADAPATVGDAPVFIMPDSPALQANPAVTVDLPLEYYPEMEPATIVVDAPAPAPAPVDVPAAAPAVPVAQAPVVKPVAPSAPAAAPAVPDAPAAPPVAAAQPPAKPNFYVPAVSAGGATTLELNLLQLINAERANAGLAPYALEGGLTKVARTRSQQLIDQNYFAHRDPYGYSMYVELLAHFGYTSYAWAGENLAMNNWSADGAAAEAMKGLMNSPTHRANLLAGDFSRIGIGHITTSGGLHYFTMIFLG